MKIEFLVEDDAHYNSDMEYKIVESCYPDEYHSRGYDIFRVEADKLSDVHVIFANGTEYEAEEAIQFKDGNEIVFYVSIWTPIS